MRVNITAYHKAMDESVSLKASPKVMEAIACPIVVMVSPSIAPSQVTMGKKATAVTINRMMGNSMSMGFALLVSVSSIVPEAGPYFSSLKRIPLAAKSSDAFMGPKSRLMKITDNTIINANNAYRL